MGEASDLLGDGADQTPKDAARAVVRDVAEWLWDWASPGYGPHGSHKLVDDGVGLVVTASPASALREADPAHPVAAPFVRLATTQQATRGDGATTALLLAAALVRRCLDATGSVAGSVVPLVDGLRLARRQVLATLSAHARAAPAEVVLAGVVPDPTWPGVVVDGLRALAEHGRVDLDALDVRPEARDDLRWDDGLVVEPRLPGRAPPPHLAEVRVALVAGVRERTVTGASLTLRDAAPTPDDRWRRVADHVAGLGVGLLLSKTALPEPLLDALLDRGVLVQQEVSKPLAWRAAVATGAEPAPDPAALTAAELGTCDLARRPPRRGGWWLRGPGVGATLLVPSAPGTVQEARVDDVERLLRAAGSVLEDPRGVPGAGAWQREAADSVAAMAPHLEGRAQLGAQAAARALRDLADALVRNGGGDPLDGPGPASADLLDPYPCVRDAVAGAFDCADALLRLDGVFRKRGSTAVDLRGGTGPAGSPKGMPGDVPPLM